MGKTHATYEVWQGGMVVARAFGPPKDAQREAMHYARIYSQDGPVEVREKAPRPKRKKREAKA